MKCKDVLGMRICKLNSSEVISLPSSLNQKIPVSIYTSKKCALCGQIVNKQLKSLSPLKNLIVTKIVDIESSPYVNPKLLSLPSIEIGNTLLGGKTSEYDIIANLRKHIPMKKVE